MIEIPRALFEECSDPKVLEASRPPLADDTFEKKLISPVKKYPPLWLEYCQTLCAELLAVHASEKDARLENGIPLLVFSIFGGYVATPCYVSGRGFWVEQRLTGLFPRSPIGQYEKFVYGFHECVLSLTQKAERRGHWQIEETEAAKRYRRRGGV